MIDEWMVKCDGWVHDDDRWMDCIIDIRIATFRVGQSTCGNLLAWGLHYQHRTNFSVIQ